jgi:hypothetical protein
LLCALPCCGAALSRHTVRHVLIAWQFAAEGWAREQLSDSALLTIVLAEAARVFGVLSPTPITVKITRWGADPYSRGAYSFGKVGGCESGCSVSRFSDW